MFGISNNNENDQIDKTIKGNEIFKDVENKKTKEIKTEFSATGIVKILKALFTFNAESYGLPPITSLIASLTISILFYSAVLALATIYWPLFIIAAIAAFVQALPILKFLGG